VDAPLNLMGINIQTLDPDAKHPVIEAAFGFKMGDVFDANKALNKFELSSGTYLYEINPVLPYEGIGKYYITTNTHDMTIDSVRAIGSFSSINSAKIEIDKISKIVNQKFTLVQKDDHLQYYKDTKGNLLLLFLKTIDDGEYEVHIHCLCPN
jgi:hypothetical protein